MAHKLAFPTIFLLPTHLNSDELQHLHNSVGTLTSNISDASVIVGKLFRRERVLFELRRLGLDAENVTQQPAAKEPSTSTGGDDPDAKRQKRTHLVSQEGVSDDASDMVPVVHLGWLTESLAKNTVLPLDRFLLSTARRPLPDNIAGDKRPQATQTHSSPIHMNELGSPGTLKPPTLQTSRSSTPGSTTETDLPPVPESLVFRYSCQRSTPANTPNADFIQIMKDIRTLRLLGGDKVGTRAYSTSIASVAAYPYLITTRHEIERLPGCGVKIAELFHEWQQSGTCRELSNAEHDSQVACLKIFYNIWGVGDSTAREFYKKGWRDLDDIIEYGWNSLSRVQQIGVKYYSEFEQRIPRAEVEKIGHEILRHARTLDAGFQMTIVGSYRRGRDDSNDVDVVLSHKDESKTTDAIDKVVIALERSNFITHTLSLWHTNSERGQAPLPWKQNGAEWGSGFDTLDKALVVWKDPSDDDSLHRRVDIIISPWKTVGCAVLGWSGETTFQRDLRRYCKEEKGYKFDSSGIRSRSTGMWIDVESTDMGSAATELEAERRVFDGLGLVWRHPSERCTG